MWWHGVRLCAGEAVWAARTGQQAWSTAGIAHTRAPSNQQHCGIALQAAAASFAGSVLTLAPPRALLQIKRKPPCAWHAGGGMGQTRVSMRAAAVGTTPPEAAPARPRAAQAAAPNTTQARSSQPATALGQASIKAAHPPQSAMQLRLNAPPTHVLAVLLPSSKPLIGADGAAAVAGRGGEGQGACESWQRHGAGRCANR